ncbi:MAG: VWA domain-containing protein [Planctomycetia bacterium]|nr:VWA domain-containing protein [Planctomycetia bacterium]
MKQELFFIIDESSSMEPRIEQIHNGFKEFISSQKKINNEGIVSVAYFNNETKIIINKKPISEISELPTGSYHPNGCTALYDAMGQILLNIQKRHEDDVEYIMIVLTDGEENFSSHFDKISLKKIIDDTTNFVKIIYMGSNQDAILNAQVIGVYTSLSYDDNNLLEAMRSTSDAVGRYRSGQDDDILYTQTERDISLEGC